METCENIMQQIANPIKLGKFQTWRTDFLTLC